MLKETTLSTKTVFNGKIFQVVTKEVLLPDGTRGTREMVKHSGAVAVVPVEAEQLYLVRQFRTPMEQELLEIPAGRLEAGESPRECAIRELAEEIGKRPHKLIELASYYSSPGYSDEMIYLFAAYELEDVERPAIDEKEFLNIEKIGFSRVKELIKKGEIMDSNSLLGIFMVLNNSFLTYNTNNKK
ncbi:MAG TPA: NUDIX hydrolase [Firmicutes bacterium]|nr:NUDIX hydrolase [Bacillota bacterium]